MIALHIWNSSSTGGSVLELILVVVTTALILALHVALLRMYRDTGPAGPRREPSRWDDLRAARRLRGGRLLR